MNYFVKIIFNHIICHELHELTPIKLVQIRVIRG